MSESFGEVAAVILAGGVGSRLRTVVNDRPKPLAQVQGRPFLAYLLDNVAAAGVRRIVFSTGFMAASIRGVFGGAYGSLSLDYAEESSPLGTGGGLRLAAERTAATTLLVLNGDSFCDVDLADVLRDHVAHRCEPSIVLVRQDDTSRFGRVEIDESRRVVAFHEKGGRAGPGWINAGIYALPRSRVVALPENTPLSIERDMFPQWLKTGLRGYQCDGDFLDIGTPESYARAAAFFSVRERRP